MMKNTFNNFEEYKASFPEEIQFILMQIRNLILKLAPEAVESISYGMPAFKWNKKPLAYFAVHKNHIGFYATPSAHTEFENELSSYKQGKGSVQFPLDKEIPLELIEKMILFKIEENK